MDWTVASAQIAYEEGRLQAWIEDYLQVEEWSNPGLLRRVRQFSQTWPEPTLIPIDRMEVLAGPAPEFKYPKDRETWETEIATILHGGMAIETTPPLLCWWRTDGSLNLADGNHRVDAARRVGLTELWAIIHPTPLGPTTPIADTHLATNPSRNEPAC